MPIERSHRLYRDKKWKSIGTDNQHRVMPPFWLVTVAHPFPIVFSNTRDKFLEIPKAGGTTFPPIGTLASRNL